jgi:hypothetical protein
MSRWSTVASWRPPTNNGSVMLLSLLRSRHRTCHRLQKTLEIGSLTWKSWPRWTQRRRLAAAFADAWSQDRGQRDGAVDRVRLSDTFPGCCFFLNTDAYRIAPPCERLRQHACGVDANTMITAQQSFLHAMLSYIADYTDVTVFTIYAIHLSCWCVNDSVCKVS